MTIEQLKELLNDGKITKEQFDVMAKALDPNYNPESDGEGAEQMKDGGGDNNTPDIEKLIQTAVDRATNKLGNDNKKLREQIEALKKSKLTDEEIKQLELKNKEDEIAEREKALTEKENRLYAIKAIKTAGLDDGSDASLELVDFVLSDTTENIDAKVKAFSALLKKYVESEVDKTFKDNGRNPGKGKTAPNGNNPYAKETFNLTEQWKLESENPELAQAMMIAAGIVK